MIQLYNTQGNIKSNLMNFFEKFKNLISKPINKMLSALILGSIKAESIVATDIAKNLLEELNAFLTIKNSMVKLYMTI